MKRSWPAPLSAKIIPLLETPEFAGCTYPRHRGTHAGGDMRRFPKPASRLHKAAGSETSWFATFESLDRPPPEAA